MSFTPAANYALTTCGEPLKEDIEEKKIGGCMDRRVGNDGEDKIKEEGSQLIKLRRRRRK
jgi:hypothetical protein